MVEEAAGENLRVECEAFKLDECAEWRPWVAMLGLRLKGLRAMALI